ncbi:MAG TPA: beta-propeller fold lactonase family protein [Galbitalea sp.]|jgi:YVTN family beta-propeller protein|nr:beta-propeller fold lactonase family protein [Galbitalea sp.]
MRNSAVIVGLAAVALAFAGAAPALADSYAPGTTLATLNLEANPQDAAIAANGQTAYVTTLDGETVDVIALSSLSVTSTIQLGQQAGAVKLTSSDHDLLVTEAQRNAVAVVDLGTEETSKTIAVGSDPIALATVPGTTKFVTSNYGSGTVTLADRSSGKSKQIAVGAKPWGIVVAPNGKFAYVAIQSSNSIAEIDLASATVTRTMPAGSRPAYLAMAPDGSGLYVADAGDGSVSTIDVGTGTLTNSVSVGGKPWGIDVSPSGDFLYICDNSGNRLVIVDTRSDSVVSSTDTGVNPDFVDASPSGNVVVVPNSTSNTVSILAGADPDESSSSQGTTSGDQGSSDTDQGSAVSGQTDGSGSNGDYGNAGTNATNGNYGIGTVDGIPADPDASLDSGPGSVIALWLIIAYFLICGIAIIILASRPRQGDPRN